MKPRPCISQGCGGVASVVPILLVWPRGADRGKTRAYRVTLGGMLLCRRHGEETAVKKFLKGSCWDQILEGWRKTVPHAEPDRDTITVMWKPLWLDATVLPKGAI